MKKLIGSLVAAFLAGTAGAATTAASAPTNIVTRVNIQLTYSSQTATNTSIGTTVTTVHGVKTTNIFTIITYKAVSTPVATKDVIAAILPGAPKGAYLAQVQSPDLGEYFAIRLGNTNLSVVTNIVMTTKADVKNGKGVDGAHGTTITQGSKELTLEEITLSTPTLSFDVTALSQSVYTGDSISIGGQARPVANTSISVAGTGTDSVGSGEIVTGTITADGAQLGD